MDATAGTSRAVFPSSGWKQISTAVAVAEPDEDEDEDERAVTSADRHAYWIGGAGLAALPDDYSRIVYIGEAQRAHDGLSAAVRVFPLEFPAGDRRLAGCMAEAEFMRCLEIINAAALVSPQQQRQRVALSLAMTAALLLAVVVPLLIALTASNGDQATLAVCIVLGVCLTAACLCRVVRARLERSVAEAVDASISDTLTELNASLRQQAEAQAPGTSAVSVGDGSWPRSLRPCYWLYHSYNLQRQHRCWASLRTGRLMLAPDAED